jgi:serine/threonine protein kinase
MTTTLITGANKGLGFETARRLIGLGHTVYVGARDRERCVDAARRPGAHFVPLDVTDGRSQGRRPRDGWSPNVRMTRHDGSRPSYDARCVLARSGAARFRMGEHDTERGHAAPPPAAPSSPPEPSRIVGRYALYKEIASGGMATVHFGRLLGPVGFARTVAIKRLHPQHARDPEFVSMFLDEARLVARIRHPNVVQTLDVVALEGELLIVMDYVQGEALWRLIRRKAADPERVPPRIATAVITGILYGLHAAHEARGERGEPLSIVHRDVSPQNILVGVDGVARILDFGVAKAAGRIHSTQGAALKGKLAYMAPEQLEGKVTRLTDIFAASIVLWEALTSERLFAAGDERETVGRVLGRPIPPPSARMQSLTGTSGVLGLDGISPEKLAELDQIVLRGLRREPSERFASARDMAIAIERSIGVASPAEVGDWVERTARAVLDQRAETVAVIESSSSSLDPHESDHFRSELRGRGLPVASPVDALVGPDPAPVPPVGAIPGDQPSQLSSISLSREPSFHRRSGHGKAVGITAIGAVALAGIVTAIATPRSNPAATSSQPSARIPIAASSSETTAETRPPSASTAAMLDASPVASSPPVSSAPSPPRPKKPGSPVVWRPPASPAPAKGTSVDSIIDTRK